MNSAAPPRFAPVSLGSAILVCAALSACVTSRVVIRAVRVLLETAWLYVSSTRG